MHTISNTGLSVIASVLMLACGFASDSGSQSEKVVVDTNADSIALVQAASSGKYSERFLKALHEHYKGAILQDSLLTLNTEETFAFPDIPRPGTPIILKGESPLLTITLTVERVNYTTITYHIEMTDSGKLTYSHSGEADLSPHFHLGAEVDEYSNTGSAYLAVEYLDPREGEYGTSIRLGYSEECGPHLLGKLIKNCNGNIRDVGLFDFPTLIERRDMGEPIDINTLKRQGWLETTSGVLSRGEAEVLCPNDSTSFFGFYELIDRSTRGGPFGRLVVRIKEKPAKWTYDDKNEEFIQLTLRSDRIKVWDEIAVGDPVDDLVAFVWNHVPYKRGTSEFVDFGGYRGWFEIADNGTIQELTIRRVCDDQHDPARP